MKITELGKPENLEKLNFMVAKICNIETYSLGNHHFKSKFLDNFSGESKRYHPTTNAKQCLEATPYCDVSCERSLNPDIKTVWAAKIVNYENPYWAEGETELIARCLALVYSVCGEDVPID